MGANKDGHLTVYRIIESMYAQMLTTWFTLAFDTLDYDDSFYAISCSVSCLV